MGMPIMPIWIWAALAIVTIWSGTLAYVHADHAPADGDTQQPFTSKAEIDAEMRATEAEIVILREQIAADTGLPYEQWVFGVNELGWSPPDAYYEIEVLASDLAQLEYAAAGCVVGTVSDWDGVATDICIEPRPTSPVERMADLAADIRGLERFYVQLEDLIILEGHSVPYTSWPRVEAANHTSWEAPWTLRDEADRTWSLLLDLRTEYARLMPGVWTCAIGCGPDVDVAPPAIRDKVLGAPDVLTPDAESPFRMTVPAPHVWYAV